MPRTRKCELEIEALSRVYEENQGVSRDPAREKRPCKETTR